MVHENEERERDGRGGLGAEVPNTLQLVGHDGNLGQGSSISTLGGGHRKESSPTYKFSFRDLSILVQVELFNHGLSVRNSRKLATRALE